MRNFHLGPSPLLQGLFRYLDDFASLPPVCVDVVSGVLAPSRTWHRDKTGEEVEMETRGETKGVRPRSGPAVQGAHCCEWVSAIGYTSCQIQDV